VARSASRQSGKPTLASKRRVHLYFLTVWAAHCSPPYVDDVISMEGGIVPCCVIFPRRLDSRRDDASSHPRLSSTSIQRDVVLPQDVFRCGCSATQDLNRNVVPDVGALSDDIFLLTSMAELENGQQTR
jgi:hypothetical protein